MHVYNLKNILPNTFHSEVKEWFNLYTAITALLPVNSPGILRFMKSEATIDTGSNADIRNSTKMSNL